MNRLLAASIFVFAPIALAFGQAETPAAPAAPHDGPTFLAETGCASCSYKLPGVTDCRTAVKLGDTAYLVEGVETNAHADGLCDATKQAHVAGKVEKGRFVASAYQIDDNPDAAAVESSTLTDAEIGCGSCSYKMAGVTGCVTAVKLGDTAYLVEGVTLDAHGAGLCDAAKSAKVAGEVVDGKFVATILIPKE